MIRGGDKRDELSFESRGVWELYTASCEGGSLASCEGGSFVNAPRPRSLDLNHTSLFLPLLSLLSLVHSPPLPLSTYPILLLPSTWKGRYVIVSGNTSNAINTFLLASCTMYACMGG